MTKEYLDGKYDWKSEGFQILEKIGENQKKNYEKNFPPLNLQRKNLQITTSQEDTPIIKDIFQKTNQVKEIARPNNGKETAFQQFLPIYLRGKKPRDLDAAEKKEYRNLQRKFSRDNETDDVKEQKKRKLAEARARAKENETEQEQEKRKEKEREQKSRSREIETEETRKIRNQKKSR